MDKAVTGGCLCGKVRYEVRGKLRDVIACHCITGSRAPRRFQPRAITTSASPEHAAPAFPTFWN